jgi:hypothetical protein
MRIISERVFLVTGEKVLRRVVRALFGGAQTVFSE